MQTILLLGILLSHSALFMADQDNVLAVIDKLNCQLSLCFCERDLVLLHLPALDIFPMFSPLTEESEMTFSVLKNKSLNPTKYSSYLLFLYFHC